jgi:uncharacterized membrane protein YfcA
VKRITGLDWPLLAPAGCLLALSAGGAIGVTHFDDPPSEGLPIYVPCILILIAKFALRRRRKAEEAHADAVTA